MQLSVSSESKEFVSAAVPVMPGRVVFIVFKFSVPVEDAYYSHIDTDLIVVSIEFREIKIIR